MRGASKSVGAWIATLACLATASGCAASLDTHAAPVLESSARAASVDAPRGRFESTDSAALAAAAREAVATHAVDLVPAITAAVERLNEPGGDAGEPWALQFLLDALIQLDARVEPELLHALRSRVPATPLLVLAAREPQRHLEFLAWASDALTDEDEWCAANELLAEHAPDRAVRCALATVRPQLSLDVMDDALLRISEVDECWIRCSRTHIPTAFRPLPRYGLSSTRASTSAAERLTRGPTGWAVARQVIDGPSMPHCQSPLNRRATALELLRWMLDAPRGRPSVKPTMHATLVLEDAEEFVESAAQAIQYAQGEWQDLRDKLVARGWIAAADAKAIGALTVVVNDYRFDRRERLPSIPGAEAARTPPIAAQPTLAPGFPRPMKLPR